MNALKNEKILTDHVGTTSEALTGSYYNKQIYKKKSFLARSNVLSFPLGLAQIIVEDSGQNSIVIVPGANNYLTPEDVVRSRDMLDKAKIMLSVLEIPRQTVLRGLKLANELGGISLLDTSLILVFNTTFLL